MTRAFTLALLLASLVACTHVPVAANRSSAAHDLALSLEIIQSEVPVGTVPRFRLTLKNVSDRACRILDADRRGDLRHTYYELVVLQDGRAVEVPTTISDPGPVSETDWLEILPGSTKTFTLADFPEQFDTLRPGMSQAYVDFWRDPLQSHTTAYTSPHVRFIVTK